MDKEAEVDLKKKRDFILGSMQKTVRTMRRKQVSWDLALHLLI